MSGILKTPYVNSYIIQGSIILDYLFNFSSNNGGGLPYSNAVLPSYDIWTNSVLLKSNNTISQSFSFKKTYDKIMKANTTYEQSLMFRDFPNNSEIYFVELGVEFISPSFSPNYIKFQCRIGDGEYKVCFIIVEDSVDVYISQWYSIPKMAHFKLELLQNFVVFTIEGLKEPIKETVEFDVTLQYHAFMQLQKLAGYTNDKGVYDLGYKIYQR